MAAGAEEHLLATLVAHDRHGDLRNEGIFDDTSLPLFQALNETATVVLLIKVRV